MDTPQCGMLAPELLEMLTPAMRPCLGKLLIAPHILGISKHVFRCERHAEVTKRVNTSITFVDYDVWLATNWAVPVPIIPDTDRRSLSSRTNRPPKRRRMHPW